MQRFKISPIETVSNTICLRVMRKSDKTGTGQISAVFGGPFSIMTVQRCSDMGLFSHLSNHAFRSL